MPDSFKAIITATIISMTLLLIWGCYPKRIGEPASDGKRLTWAEMNFEERKVHMQQAVMPIAGDVFYTWQPEKFKDIDCTLCHGQRIYAGNFDMPNNQLPKLSGDLLLGPEFKQHPNTTRLKLNRLVPEMADALGLKSFSLITRSGFGCYSCHLGPEGAMFGN